MTRVLAISSTGGHWVQLNRLMPAFEGCEVHWACTSADHEARLNAAAKRLGQPVASYTAITDANRWTKAKLVKQMLEVVALLLKLRPDVIVTTGASVGYFAIRVGRLTGARTCWIDSIANGDELSLSGEKAGPHADLFLTQWPEVAKPGGPLYRGAVL
ncbi:UDP-N-acetylglucosamine--LPS N-acetylglucosamine transferase [Sandaracinobacter neustonicus]|uniref:UDP-N-acetylglucosamine--LPS N-acetylglucosamine transferase n=1 Tax=Sandaracinobacter neustonicus TaxID=1715348 RepID=A0A501XI47_9SPHN|nr:UDP-N-acetylglucosamine--LPS N-acetylglucosamine transferase [Sandaracinobacter neustonicus]TPE60155.1 UDP-N-acetylglucosamine--LPS N-acetylglucosamine transferase [Sandaracinobacter neustonicus]